MPLLGPLRPVLAAAAAALLPAARGLALVGEPPAPRARHGGGPQEARRTEATAPIGSARDLELAMQRSDLHRRPRTKEKYLGCSLLNQTEPRIVHMLHLPWDAANGTLKLDGPGFDHGFYDRVSLLQHQAGSSKYCIKVWEPSHLRSYVTAEYPGLWELVGKKADRPAALEDFYRLLVVHDFGGMFWQYGAEPTPKIKSRPDPLELFMPPEGMGARLLLERGPTQEQVDGIGRTAAADGTSKRNTTSLKRIATHIFSAWPHNEFLRFACKRALFNLMSMPAKKDSDISEITGSGMFSEALGDFQKLGRAHNINVVGLEAVLMPVASRLNLVSEAPSEQKPARIIQFSKTSIKRKRQLAKMKKLTKRNGTDAHNTSEISSARDLERAMQRNEIYRHAAHARHVYLKCPALNATNATQHSIVHMLVFPWDKTNQTIKADESDFDHALYDEMSSKLRGMYCVKLWRPSDLRSYVRAEYPGLWELVGERARRPAALLYFYRLLVVHDFGGVFWQNGAEPTRLMWKLPDPLEPFMPPEGKSARLLIKRRITQERAEEMNRTHMSRTGRSPPLVRIATQVFAARPHNDFMRFACKRALFNLLSIPAKSDSDILETMGGGMVSEALEDFEKLGRASSIDVVEPEQLRKMVVDFSELSSDQSGTRVQNTTLIERGKEAAKDLDLMLQKSDLHRHWHARQRYLNCPVLNTTGIHIVHMLYFPYNKTTQTMKADESDFDHKFYNKMRTKLEGRYCIKLWKLSDMRSYVTAEYPGLWELVEKKADRPVALVDFYRLLVVYDFGGVFWQYGSELTRQMWELPDPFEPFMPPKGKGARLMVEKWLTQEQADEIGRTRASRQGKAPALRRIATQVFAAWPHNDFLRFACRRAIWNLLTIPVKRDYDILETMGNGMFSEAFNDFEAQGKAASVDVLDDDKKYQMVHFSHTFSWRKDKGRCC